MRSERLFQRCAGMKLWGRMAPASEAWNDKAQLFCTSFLGAANGSHEYLLVVLLPEIGIRLGGGDDRQQGDAHQRQTPPELHSAGRKREAELKGRLVNLPPLISVVLMITPAEHRKERLDGLEHGETERGGGGRKKEHRIHRKWKIGGIEAESLPAADVFPSSLRN